MAVRVLEAALVAFVHCLHGVCYCCATSINASYLEERIVSPTSTLGVVSICCPSRNPIVVLASRGSGHCVVVVGCILCARGACLRVQDALAFGRCTSSTVGEFEASEVCKTKCRACLCSSDGCALADAACWVFSAGSRSMLDFERSCFPPCAVWRASNCASGPIQRRRS